MQRKINPTLQAGRDLDPSQSSVAGLGPDLGDLAPGLKEDGGAHVLGQIEDPGLVIGLQDDPDLQGAGAHAQGKILLFTECPSALKEYINGVK